MDHKQALTAIPPEITAKLRRKRDRHGLQHLALHLGLILLTGGPIWMNVPFWGLLLPLHGIVLCFLFTLEHECTHQTPFASAWLCETVGRCCGLVILLPFTWFRFFHLAHHRHTHDPDLDPELVDPVPDTWPAFLIHLSGFRYWHGMARTIIASARGDAAAPYVPVKAQARVIKEARLMLLAYGVLGLSLFFSWALLWLWIIPVILGQPFLRLYLMAEHGRCPHVANMLENTRTTFTTPMIRFLAWNMPYHTEHHADPQVPFHQLPALHHHLRQHLVNTTDGYTTYTAETIKTLT